jgi:pSer/pThr/pTyr-binding forkhead associated (FHA) protein
MLCVLHITSGPRAGEKVWLRTDEWLQVGRDPAADLSLPEDAHLSRIHFTLEGIENGFRIRDLGSSNSTFLNGARIEFAPLNNSDRIVAGKTSFSIEISKGIKLASGDSTTDQPNLAQPLPAESTDNTMPIGASDLDEETIRTVYGGVGRPDMEQAPGHSKSPESEGAPAQSPPPASSGLPVNEPASPGVAQASSAKSGMGLTCIEPTSARFTVAQVATRLSEDTQIMAVVNRTQLDVGAQGMIDHAVACQHAWSISDTLFVVDDGQAARVGDIMERSLGRDGAICLGVKTGGNFVVTELRRQASLFSYPSMLFDELRHADESEKRLLFEHIRFMLFERDSTAAWVLISEPDFDFPEEVRTAVGGIRKRPLNTLSR